VGNSDLINLSILDAYLYVSPARTGGDLGYPFIVESLNWRIRQSIVELPDRKHGQLLPGLDTPLDLFFYNCYKWML
jgi:hypothetical protein